MNKKYTKEQIISAMQLIHAREGKCTHRAMNDSWDTPSTTAAISAFGSWKAALKAANIDTLNSPKEFSRNELIEKLNELHERDGKCTIEGLKKHPDMPTISQYRDEFGKWNNALEVAGIPTSKRNRYTREEKINFLRMINEKEGKCTVDLLGKYPDGPRFSTIINEFGSWQGAMIAAGIE